MTKPPIKLYNYGKSQDLRSSHVNNASLDWRPILTDH